MLRLFLKHSLFVLLLFFTVFLYWPGLNGGFLLDDYPNLQPLNALDSGMADWRDIAFDNESGKLGRPVSMLTLVLNYLLNGNDPWNYKYTNLMIHLLCGVLIFWLSYRLLLETRLRDQRYTIALWVMTMWLITPMQVSTVLYVIQRMAQLSTLFVLAGLITYTIGRQSLEKKPIHSISLILAVFVIWLPLAIFSKENGALLPLLAGVIELYFFRRPDIPWQRRFILFTFTITLVIPALLLLLYLAGRPEFVTAPYQNRDFTLIERLYSEARILIIYLRSLLIPDSTSLGILHDDFNKSSGLLTPVTTLLSILAWTLAVVMAWIHRNKKWNIYFFAPAFFLCAHAMESSIFALELYFEHRNYLASFSIYLMLAYGLYTLWRRYNNHLLAGVFLILFPLAHVTATYQRVQVWKSPISIILNDIYWHPKSFRAHGTIAVMYIQTGDFQNALYHIDHVMKLKPRVKPEAHIFRFLAICGSNSPIEDSEYQNYRDALNSPGTFPPTDGLILLREYTREGKCESLDLPRFIDIFEDWSKNQTAPVSNRKLWVSNVHMAQFMFDSGLDKYKHTALDILERSMKLIPSNLEAGLLKIKYSFMLGKYDEAWRTLHIVKNNDQQRRQDYSRMISRYEKTFNELKNRGLWSPRNGHTTSE